MTGTWGDPDDRAFITGIARELVPCERIEVGGDVHAVLMGASFGRPGVIVYAGTGSIAYAVEASGRQHRTGGWGYLIDDLGGGYHTGRAALTAAFRASDGRAPATSLTNRLLRHFGASSLDELRRIVYLDDGIDRPSMARLARLVADAARAGDAVATGILEDAGRQLAGLASATLGKLPEREAADVFVAGGLFASGPALLNAFTDCLLSAHAHAVVRRPEFPPVVGAWLMALRAAGGDIDEPLRRRLSAEVERLGLT